MKIAVCDDSREDRGTLRALLEACYDVFRAARQEINSGVAGMEVQGGFDARAGCLPCE